MFNWRCSCLFVAVAAVGCANVKSIETAEELRRSCRYDDARALLNAELPGFDGDNRARALLVLGTVEEASGDLQKAIGHYLAAGSTSLVQPIWHLESLKMLGLASVRARAYPTGIEALESFIAGRARIQLRVEIPWRPYAALGVALAESGRLAEAAKQFELAAARAGGRSDWLTARRRDIEQALATGKPPAAGYFWGSAYGDERALTDESADFELVPVQRVAPVYPRGAAMGRVEGFANALVTIDEIGRVTSVEVVESEPEGVFDAATVAALRSWRFRPNIKNCVPVPAEGYQQVDYRMQGH